MKQKLIIIAGQTASSKSEIGMMLAQELNGEIVNADSIQVYRYFDIGSAKPPADFRKKIPHHLIDILDPDQEFNASVFQKLADAAVSEISGRGRMPIIVGGTGLYIRCFLYGLFPQNEEAVVAARKEWDRVLDEKGLPYVYNLLLQTDPEAAAQIHPNDRIRITRALEFHSATGQLISSMRREYNFENPRYDFLILVPEFPRDETVRRIEGRTREMYAGGIADEVRSIIKRGYAETVKPFKSIGYRDALALVKGTISEEEAVRRTISDTKAYAKRQRVWFRKEKNVRHIAVHHGGFAEFISAAKNFLHNG